MHLQWNKQIKNVLVLAKLHSIYVELRNFLVLWPDPSFLQKCVAYLALLHKDPELSPISSY